MRNCRKREDVEGGKLMLTVRNPQTSRLNIPQNYGFAGLHTQDSLQQFRKQ